MTISDKFQNGDIVRYEGNHSRFNGIWCVYSVGATLVAVKPISVPEFEGSSQALGMAELTLIQRPEK